MALSFEQMKQAWTNHRCDSQAGVCDHRFDFYCTSCGQLVVTDGESMDTYIGLDGVCQNCHYGKQARMQEFSGEKGSIFGFVDDADAGYMCEWCQRMHWEPCDLSHEAQAQINELRSTAHYYA